LFYYLSISTQNVVFYFVVFIANTVYDSTENFNEFGFGQVILAVNCKVISNQTRAEAPQYRNVFVGHTKCFELKSIEKYMYTLFKWQSTVLGFVVFKMIPKYFMDFFELIFNAVIEKTVDRPTSRILVSEERFEVDQEVCQLLGLWHLFEDCLIFYQKDTRESYQQLEELLSDQFGVRVQVVVLLTLLLIDV